MSDWVRRLNDYESIVYNLYISGKMGSCDVLTINSSRELSSKVFKKAMEHLRRKSPNLRLVVQEKDKNELWFREISTKLDFKFLDGVPYDTHILGLLDARHNMSEGPLWSISVLPSKRETPSISLDEQISHIFQYGVYFCVNHVISDGYTNQALMSAYHTILDDIISGRTVDDEEQIAKLVNPYEFQQEAAEQADKLKNEVGEEGKTLTQIFGDISPVNFGLVAQYGDYSKSNHSTAFIERSLAIADTKSFVNLCKIKNVTVNSAFSALCDLAFHRMLGDEYASSGHISSMQSLNLRRYRSDNASKELGLNVEGAVVTSTREFLYDIRNFWDHARWLNKTIHEAIQSKKCFQTRGIVHSHLDPGFVERFQNTIPSIAYISSNMGDLDKKFYNHSSRTLLVTNVDRYVQASTRMISFCYHTIRGHFNLSASYHPNGFPSHVAEKLVNHIFDGLVEASFV